ncbi:mechanosensitive ion channel family protein [Adhaeribacter soli]|uniref:Mechanosensitive ion channel n=1 Tax=Adhaeribacter soli TaxID=2607655 RepID=A0A5N1J0W4_9BACT|nr:mechanosensitive ion channel [Adhaeribacter soli]KAA9340038.1 mechanosensitive ion channel [Adhaeribacter soli]
MNQFNDAFYLLTEKLRAWGQHLIVMLPNLVIAILVLIITFIFARLSRKAAENLLPRISHSVALNNLAATMVYAGVVLMGLFFTLGILNLDKTVTSLLAGVGIIGLALGFAFQDIAANFISGVIIAVRKPFGVGDVIETNEHFGTIERINLRTIDIRRQTGELVKVPNRKVFESPTINFTYYGLRRIDLNLRVSYNEDLEKVVAVTLEAMQGITGQIESKEVEVYFEEFAESTIIVLVRFWIHYARQTDYVNARSEAIMKIKKAFDVHHIRFPYPARALHFDGSKGQPLFPFIAEMPPVPPTIEPFPTPHTGPGEAKPSTTKTFEEETDKPNGD